MPAPPGHFLRAKGQDGSRPRVLGPFRSDGMAGYHSDDAKRNVNALDLLKDLRSTTAVHGSMLHELKEIYKHLRVELKDDIYDLVEQIRSLEASPASASGARRRAKEAGSPLPRSNRASGMTASRPGSFCLPNIPDEHTRVTCVEDVEDETPTPAEPEARPSAQSARHQAKHFAWDAETEAVSAERSEADDASDEGNLRKTTISVRRPRDPTERMPAVPLEKRPYLSSVDLFNRALQVDDDAGWIERMVRRDSFDYVVGSLLVLNAVIIGVQVDLVSKDPSDPTWSRAIDLFFCLVFVAELIIRITAFGRSFFSMDGWQWNLFDSIVVFFSVADEVTKLVLTDSEVQEIFDSFGFLRLLRLGRIVRLVRMVRLIPALKSMVYLILASLKSFLWTVVLLIILMYCVAVYFTELAYDLHHKHPQKDFAMMRQTWGSVAHSIFSLFQAITGGNDWHNFISVFDDFVGSTNTNTLVFSIFIAFATLVMMNLVTGVFVEGAQRIAREEKNQELLKHVKKLLAPDKSRKTTARPSVILHVDDHGDELISWVSFCRKLETEEMRAYLTAFELDASQAKDIFYILDQDRRGTVTMREFFSACVNLHGRPKLADTAILRHLIQRTFADLVEQLEKMEAKMGGEESTSPKMLSQINRTQFRSFSRQNTFGIDAEDD